MQIQKLYCPECGYQLDGDFCAVCRRNLAPEPARSDADSVRVQRVDAPAARWEENARALLKLALELAYEVKSRCKDPIHDEQIASLRALETEWAGSGHIEKLTD
jgi:hypothetical protein